MRYKSQNFINQQKTMKVSESIIGGRQAYRKLRSRQSSLKKNQSNNQTTEKSFNLPAYSATPITERVQVSEFKLPVSVPQNYLNYQGSPFQFGKPHFQIQLNQLQMGIECSIMEVFKKECIQLSKCLRLTSNINEVKSFSSNQQYPKETGNINLKIQQRQPQIYKDSSNFSVNTVSYNLPLSSANQSEPNQDIKELTHPVNRQNGPNKQFSNQMAYVSFRKLQNLLKNQFKLEKQTSNQSENDNFNQQNSSIEKNSQKNMKRNLFQTENHASFPQEHLKTDDSQDRLRDMIKTINSPSLQLSPDQKQFRRSFQFIKGNPSQIKSDEAELSLISTEKTSTKKKPSLINSIYDSLSNGKKVLVTNKLIFLREPV